MSKTRVGFIQASSKGSKELNLAHVEKQILKLANEGTNIICLQELFLTDYFCFEENQAAFNLAEAIPGASTSYLSELAKSNNIVIIASLFEKRTAGIYHNSIAVIDADGQYLGKYRKTHIPDDPGFHEKYYFTEGDTGYQVFKTKFGTIGTLICWDQWFPEAARLTALKGAEILFYPTAIGWDKKASSSVNEEELAAWKTIQQSHAIANGVHVVSVNRIGEEHNTKFWGHSFICNPFGKILLEAGSENELSASLEIDTNRNRHYREVWPFFRDRRIDTYKGIEKRFLDEDE